MKILIYAAGLALAIGVQPPKISVRELPPGPIPRGGCTESRSGYLGIEESAKNRFQLSREEIGEYILSRTGQGYSLSLYPQENGRIFVIARCESVDAKASRQAR